MDANTPGGFGIAGAAGRATELTAWSATSLLLHWGMSGLLHFVDWFRDLPLRAGLWVLDRIAGPYPETPVDRAIREEGERLRSAFPTIDFDDPRPRTIPPAERG